jgi:hypothetical protein
MTDERIREQNRLRQLRKRQRQREERLDRQALAEAEKMIPKAWRTEWLERVKNNRERAKGAAAEVEKMLPLLPEAARHDFVVRNRANTKVSLPVLRNNFLREKEKAEREAKQAEGLDGDGWGERYPGSPPDQIMQELAARFPARERLDADKMAQQRGLREYVGAHERLAPELRLMALGLA